MKLTDCLSSLGFFMYCSAVVLVIVNGQPTTDERIGGDRDEIVSNLIDTVTELRAELATAIVRIGNLENQDASEFSTLTCR